MDESEIIHIERDMLPADVLSRLKVNDILEWKVVNLDENGLISVTYNKAAGQGSTMRDEAEGMMTDFKDYMSARNGEGEEETA